MRSDPTLKKLYRYYNRRYFSNSLPRTTVVRWAEDGEDLSDECQSRTVLACANVDAIVMNPRMRRLRWWNTIRFTLLHEMVHVLLPVSNGHGRNFQAEMLRLAREKAFEKLW